MVLSFVCCRMLWFPVFMATLLFSISSADHALINTICSGTSNNTLCLQVLKDSAGADRVSLGKTAADAALGHANITRNLIYSLEMGARDIGEGELYGAGLIDYFFVIELLYGYKISIANKDFHLANLKASMALAEAEMFSKSDPHMPPELKEANLKDRDYISIPLVVSHV